ncbi:hypothetical protein GCM10027280_12320 [Micromonospora polyrhachis]|uniref:Uncharacterized protein n=1 Tax=Micromonospora polyrhachis TaxID=1282883 RepID=A0A7W7STB0_9ACTN|nr:hypothetical protein [Micromonospora polyrhachis]MBB4959967.1 hypothetical protein [Micromonospora polyrhachis]
MPGDLLARRYRRLLVCYPRAYRRSRGEEIVDTLLDNAPPGRTRPTVQESVNLIRHGLRARLGRPASRTVVFCSVLTAVICALFTAAAATRVAWETSPPQPNRAEATAIFSTILPDHNLDDISVPPALFVIYGQPLDGGEYALGATAAYRNGVPPVDQRHTLALAQQRLRETGWRVYEPTGRNSPQCEGPSCDLATLPTDTTLLARRGDTILELTLTSDFAYDSAYLSVSLRPATPAAVYPAGVLGGLFGAVAAWLLFAWASRRTERHPGRETITALFTATMLLWWLPVLPVAPGMIHYGFGAPRPQWPALWEFLGQPTFFLSFLAGCAGALLGLALAALPAQYGRRARRPHRSA